MTLAYIAIGSNLASPLEQVNAAVQALGEIPQSRSWRSPRSTARRRWARRISLTISTPPWCWKLP
jgi:7,8-dihydro-6-hydroxymethylpterin-pyrophosphokinase